MQVHILWITSKSPMGALAMVAFSKINEAETDKTRCGILKQSGHRTFCSVQLGADLGCSFVDPAQCVRW